MGFFSKLTDVAIPTALGAISGGPAGAFAGFIGGAKAGEAKRKFANQEQMIAEQQRLEREKFMEVFGSGNLSTLQRPIAGSTANAGFGAGFGQFLTDVGRNIVSPFAGLATQLSPFFGRSEIQQPAITTTRRIGAQESQTSGSQEAFIGAPGIAPLINLGRQFIKSPIGQIGTGTGLGAFVGALTDSEGKKVRITRKMKSQARTVLNMVNGDLSAAAAILNIQEAFLIQVLLKRFRNDGPVVTKAALRKTKQTVRRMKSMCDMYDDLRPRAKRTTRAPMRRASTTLISNK